MHHSQRVATLVLVALFWVAPAFASNGGESNADLIQFDFFGFSIAPAPQNPGDRLELVMVLNPSTTTVPIGFDFENNEYTVHISAMVLNQVVNNGPLQELHYIGGLAEIYEDPAKNAPFAYDTDPADVPDLDPAVVPSTFRDGTLFARLVYFNYIELWYAPAGIGSIAYTHSELRAVGGSAYPEMQQHFLIIGWHNGGGFTNDAGAFIPAGYAMRYDALLKWESPLAVEETTWGGIKGVFR